MDENLPLRRIQKLLALAQNAGSEAEASLAAARAASIMAQHNITEAELRLLDPHNKAEPIEQRFVVDDASKKRVAWKSTIAYGVAVLYGCYQYWTGGTIRVLGRRSSCEAVKYTYQYLVREVEQLCTEAYFEHDPISRVQRNPDRGATKRWKGNFRLGAANEISRRLCTQARTEKQARTQALKDAAQKARESFLNTEAGMRAQKEREARRERAASGEDPNIFDDLFDDFQDEQQQAANLVASLTQANLPPSTIALAVVEKDEDEVKSSYKRYSKTFSKATPLGRVTSMSAYKQGVAAGARVRLGGGRGSLPKAPGQIRGRS